ncbi:MAG TPA: hypothetical protein DCZ94_14935 [Lentisphaeria bacterium]|nr:MAG: hypothetical protein A2X48_03090 [Lentisphaerae bacterium GWF2_49_21]HBC88244.1 hypothetical protein [Lentisphaeria bacterium]
MKKLMMMAVIMGVAMAFVAGCGEKKPEGTLDSLKSKAESTATDAKAAGDKAAADAKAAAEKATK